MQSPYENYKKSNVWNIIKKALKDLEENKDIEITTRDEYIIGYIVKSLIENNIISE